MMNSLYFKRMVLGVIAGCLSLVAGAQDFASQKLSDLKPMKDRKADIYNFYEASVSKSPNWKSPKQNKDNNSPANLLDIPMGSSGNGFSVAFGPKTYLVADASSNTIVFTHRSNPAAPGHPNTTGAIMYDYSTDGGNTWSNDNIVHNPVAIPSNGGPARYPQGVLINPTKSTNPAHVRYVFSAPSLNVTNGSANPNGPGSWGGIAYGVTIPGSPGVSRYEASSTTTTPYLIPDNAAASDTVVWSAEIGQLYNGLLDDYVPTGDINVYKEVVSGSTVAFSVSKVSQETHYGNGSTSIVFAPDNKTGYLVLRDNDTTLNPVETIMFMIWKTTDGGTTWNRIKDLIIDKEPGLKPVKDSIINTSDLVLWSTDTLSLSAARDTAAADTLTTYQIMDTISITGTDTIVALSELAIKHYTASFDHDCIVDGLGNLHIITSVHNNGFSGTNGKELFYTSGDAAAPSYSVFTSRSRMVIADMYLTDADSTWAGKVIGRPYTFRGNFGDNGTQSLSEDLRPQLSRSPDGTKILATYIDTDTTAAYGFFASATTNSNPDMFGAMLDVTTGTWGPTRNFNGEGLAGGGFGTGYEGLMVMANLSPELLVDSNSVTDSVVYKVPVNYSQFSGDLGSPVTYSYLTGINFTTPKAPVQGISNELSQANNGNNFNVYPNPAYGSIMASFNGVAELVQVIDLSGRVVAQTSNLLSGQSISLSGLTPGMYIVRATMENSNVHTAKVLVK